MPTQVEIFPNFEGPKFGIVSDLCAKISQNPAAIVLQLKKGH